MAGGDGFAGGLVVGNGVGAEDVVLVGDEDVAREEICIVVFGLCVGLEDGAVGVDVRWQRNGAWDGAEIVGEGLLRGVGGC